MGWRIGSGVSQAAMPPAGTRWLGAQFAGAGAGAGAGWGAAAHAWDPGAGLAAGHVAGPRWPDSSDLIARIARR